MHIVMEYAAGGTLHDFLCNQEGKLLSEDTIWEIFVQIASAVKYMHQCNILHRDLKTANILIMGDVRSAAWARRGQVRKPVGASLLASSNFSSTHILRDHGHPHHPHHRLA